MKAPTAPTKSPPKKPAVKPEPAAAGVSDDEDYQKSIDNILFGGFADPPVVGGDLDAYVKQHGAIHAAGYELLHEAIRVAIAQLLKRAGGFREHELSAATAWHEAEVKELKKEHEAAVKQLKKEHEAEVAKLKTNKAAVATKPTAVLQQP